MSDLIDRQTAIEALTDYWHGIENRHKTLDGEMAVYCDCKNIIKNLPSAQPTQTNTSNMLDAISRRDAVSRFSDLLMAELRGERLPTWDEVYNAIKELPPIQPRCNFPEKAQLSGEDTTSAYKENTKKLLARMKNMQIEIIPVEEPERWIPVSEYKPEPFQEVLVTLHENGWNGETYDTVKSQAYDGDYKITAWMPLPEPYKEDKR